MTLDYAKAAARVEDVTQRLQGFWGCNVLATGDRPTVDLVSRMGGVPPLLCVVHCLDAVSSPGSGGAGVAIGLTDSRQRGLIANTIALESGAMAVACAVGVPLGIALSRCDPRRVQLIRFVFAVRLVLPSYVLTLAWILLFSTLLDSWAYSLPAAMAVLGFSFYPIVMLTTEAVLRSISSRLEEAGRLIGSPLRVWAGILFPLAGPACGQRRFSWYLSSQFLTSLCPRCFGSAYIRLRCSQRSHLYTIFDSPR